MTDLAVKRELTLERALGLVEDWADWQGHPTQGPRAARDLLAVWGALARLYRPEEFPAEAAPLTDLLRREAGAVLAAAARALADADWIVRARELDAAWDFAANWEAVHEMELDAVTLFDELDRWSLAVCMAARLDPEGATAQPWAAWRRQAAEAEDWFAGHVDAFLPVAPLAGATLAACREALEEDESLWQTVLKHRLVEEAAEEAEAVPALPRLTDADRQAIEARVSRKCAANGAAAENGPEAVDGWLARLRGWAAVCLPGWSPSYQPRFVTGSAPAESPRPAYRVSWADPGGDCTAELLLPTYFRSPADPLTLTFRRGDRRLANDLAGAGVELGGVRGHIGPDGVVTLSAEQFQAAGPTPVLIVEREGASAEWPLRDKSVLGKDSRAG